HASGEAAAPFVARRAGQVLDRVARLGLLIFLLQLLRRRRGVKLRLGPLARRAQGGGAVVGTRAHRLRRLGGDALTERRRRGWGGRGCGGSSRCLFGARCHRSPRQEKGRETSDQRETLTQRIHFVTSRTSKRRPAGRSPARRANTRRRKATRRALRRA